MSTFRTGKERRGMQSVRDAGHVHEKCTGPRKANAKHTLTARTTDGWNGADLVFHVKGTDRQRKKVGYCRQAHQDGANSARTHGKNTPSLLLRTERVGKFMADGHARALTGTFCTEKEPVCSRANVSQALYLSSL